MLSILSRKNACFLFSLVAGFSSFSCSDLDNSEKEEKKVLSLPRTPLQTKSATPATPILLPTPATVSVDTSLDIWKQPKPDYEWAPEWTSDSRMLAPRGSPAVVASDKFIYVLGGGDAVEGKNIIQSSVEFAEIHPDGTIGSWEMTSPMNTKRIFEDAVIVGKYIYALGGEKGYDHEDLLSTIERAEIMDDGSLSPWIIETEKFNTPRRALVASFYDGWMYAFGGYNGTFLSDVERARVQKDGSLGKWEYEPEESKSERYIHTGAIYKNFVYLFGGHVRNAAVGTDAVEWATIGPGGTIGGWEELPPMPTRRVGGDTVILHENVYVAGGQNTITLSAVDRAPLLPDGKLGQWVQETPLKGASVGVSLAVANDVVYAIGGSNNGVYLPDVHRAYYASGRPLGTWTNDPKQIAVLKWSNKPLPRDAENHFRRGMDLLVKRDFDASITEYELGLKIVSGFPQPHNYMGIAYQEKKMYDQAMSQFQKAIQLAPDFPPAHFNLGNIYREQGFIQKAEDSYRESLRIDSNYVNARKNLMLLLVDTKRCAQAAGFIENFLKTNPKDPLALSQKKRCGK